MGGAALSAGGLAGVDPGASPHGPPDPQRPVPHLGEESVRDAGPALPRLASRGRQRPRLRKPTKSPAQGHLSACLRIPVLQPRSQTSTGPSLSIWSTLPSPRTHLHLTLALAKVLSSELPSHMRLWAATGHTTQGHGLQFLNFQHLGRCLQELRGCCRERGISGCQRGCQAKEHRWGDRSGLQPSAQPPVRLHRHPQPRVTLPPAPRAKTAPVPPHTGLQSR